MLAGPGGGGGEEGGADGQPGWTADAEKQYEDTMVQYVVLRKDLLTVASLALLPQGKK